MRLACAFCGGNGRDRYRTGQCRVCNAKGRVDVVEQRCEPCNYCAGSGDDLYKIDVCPRCRGLGRLTLEGEPLALGTETKGISASSTPRQDPKEGKYLSGRRALLAEIGKIRDSAPAKNTVRNDSVENLQWFGRASAAIEKWNPSKSALVQEHLNLFFSNQHAMQTMQGFQKLVVLLDQASSDLRLQTDEDSTPETSAQDRPDVAGNQRSEEPMRPLPENQPKSVFIGHGRSHVWRQLKDFLTERMGLRCDEFNSEAAAGISTTERLETMLGLAGFAFLVMTAEDTYADATTHARENVIHEAGLFQGRLGFRRAIILLEEGCTQFSNIHGLTHIPFPKSNLSAVFEDVRRVLEREQMV